MSNFNKLDLSMTDEEIRLWCEKYRLSYVQVVTFTTNEVMRLYDIIDKCMYNSNVKWNRDSINQNIAFRYFNVYRIYPDIKKEVV